MLELYYVELAECSNWITSCYKPWPFIIVLGFYKDFDENVVLTFCLINSGIFFYAQ